MSFDAETDETIAPVADAEPSLRDSLSDAFDASISDDAGETPAEPIEAKPTDAAPVRDAQGRFIPKAADTTPAAKPSEPVAQTGGIEPASQAIVPPASWSATAKAEFTKASPAIQQEVLKREAEMDQGRAQWQQGAERLNRLDQVLAPRREQLQLAGIDEVRAVETLFAAQDLLNRDPVGGMLYLGRSSGVNWNALFQRLQGSPAEQQPQLPPQVMEMQRQLAELRARDAQRDQAAQTSQLQNHLSEIQTFAADPANTYFENVKSRMSGLLKTGQAKGLQDAYDQACWADPEVRGLLLNAKAQEQQAQVRTAAAQKAAQARHASGSITGSPTPGASPGAGKPRSQSVRDSIAEAWDAHA